MELKNFKSYYKYIRKNFYFSFLKKNVDKKIIDI